MVKIRNNDGTVLTLRQAIERLDGSAANFDGDEVDEAALAVVMTAARGLVALYDGYELVTDEPISSGADFCADVFELLNGVGMPVA